MILSPSTACLRNLNLIWIFECKVFCSLILKSILVICMLAELRTMPPRIYWFFYFLLKVWRHEVTLYYIFFIIYIHAHSFITFAEFRSSFLVAVRPGRGPLYLGAAEQRFELGAALQQPDALPTKPKEEGSPDYGWLWSLEDFFI